MSRKWVVNASPLIVLGRIEHLRLLSRLAAEIVVPDGVAREIFQGPGDDPARQWLQSTGKKWIREIRSIPASIIAWNLGMGETDVLAWAYDHPGYEVIVDDRAARNCALSLKLPVRGTIGLILLAKREGYLGSVMPIFAHMRQAGFRLAPELLAAAKRLAGEE